MSTEYPKINGLWKRDQKGRIQEGDYSCPEFELLKDIKWLWHEKVDGTNIRLMWPGSNELLRGNEHFFVGGRTDKAQIPPKLLQALLERMKNTDFEPTFGQVSVVLYGEGYGAGIQKGGGDYRPDNDFVLFDCVIGDYWLSADDLADVGAKLGIDVVPRVGYMTLAAAEKAVKALDWEWGWNKAPEGLVGRLDPELRNRAGRRIMTKVKIKDYSAS